MGGCKCDGCVKVAGTLYLEGKRDKAVTDTFFSELSWYLRVDRKTLIFLNIKNICSFAAKTCFYWGILSNHANQFRSNIKKTLKRQSPWRNLEIKRKAVSPFLCSDEKWGVGGNCNTTVAAELGLVQNGQYVSKHLGTVRRGYKWDR